MHVYVRVYGSVCMYVYACTFCTGVLLCEPRISIAYIWVCIFPLSDLWTRAIVRAMDIKIKIFVLLALVVIVMVYSSSNLKVLVKIDEAMPVVYSCHASLYEMMFRNKPKFIARPIADMTFASSASDSIARVINGNRTRPLSVGDTLLVEVKVRDFAGRPKHHGGDFLLARLSNVRLGAAASGAVTDCGNGTYLVSFRISWPGESHPKVVLVHSSEAVTMLEKVREAVPDKIGFWGSFVSGRHEERSPCHVFLNATAGGRLCDFGDAERGEAWWCARPRGMPCSALRGYVSYNKYARMFTSEECQLFSSGNNLVPINIKYKVEATQFKGVPQETPPKRCSPGLGAPRPSGFYLQGVWRSTVCSARSFDTPAKVTDCLRHREVYLFGDSTIRQYMEYLETFVKALKRVDFHKSGRHQPKLAIDARNNIKLAWFCHAYPFVTASYTLKEDVQHIARRIDRMSGGSRVAVGISLGAHFTAFPLEVFRTRMRNIGGAVERLLRRSPQTRVIIKLANTRDANNPEMFNNWSTFRMNEITLDAFRGANVAFVDAWDMTASVNSAQIHPSKAIVKSQVDLFLSYIC
ncbi:NXPE family member 4-like [Petromyzon marinus]|uniref:NXPE family member 4-like n=1 Tax=Petromyzon marinus TaxID=7757 RepID=UPI003F725CFF